MPATLAFIAPPSLLIDSPTGVLHFIVLHVVPGKMSIDITQISVLLIFCSSPNPMTLTIKINHRKLSCGFQVGGDNHIWYVNL